MLSLGDVGGRCSHGQDVRTGTGARATAGHYAAIAAVVAAVAVGGHAELVDERLREQVVAQQLVIAIAIAIVAIAVAVAVDERHSVAATC